MTDDYTDCLEFVRKCPTDPGSVLYCRRCGTYVEAHQGPGEATRG